MYFLALYFQAMKDLKFEEPPSASPAAAPAKLAAETITNKPALPRLTNHAPPPTPVQSKV